MSTSPIANFISALVFLLLAASMCVSIVSATPVPAPAPVSGLTLPFLASGGAAESTPNANSNAGEAGSLALLDNLSSPSFAQPAAAAVAPVTGAGNNSGSQLGSPLSLLGRVVAYRAPSVQNREHRERDEEEEREDSQPLKRAERFQLRMMRRSGASI